MKTRFRKRTARPDTARIGGNLKRRREAAGLRQVDLAEQCAIGQSFLNQLENGQNCPSIRTLLDLCRVLKCTPNDLLM